jgi:hypothetical protein
MRLRRGGKLALVGAIMLVFVAIGAHLALRVPPEDRAPHPFNQDRNAVWLEHRWLEKAQSVAEMETLFVALSSRGVQYVYPHLSPFERTGRLPAHSREQMRLFLQVARRSAPEMKVLPWIGGVRVGYRRMRPGTIDLADLGQRQRIVAECRGLIDEGFDGVHVNIEPLNDGNDDYLALLHAMRNAVGPDKLLSIAAIRPAPFTLPMTRNFLWTAYYYRRVAATVDQIVIMVYDTGLPTAALYRRYVSYAARFMTSTLGDEKRVRVLLGLPTYDETGIMHRAGVETLDNALLGVVSGLRGKGEGGTFEGVALYAEWTTTPEEWAMYEQIWRGRPQDAVTESGAGGGLKVAR